MQPEVDGNDTLPLVGQYILVVEKPRRLKPDLALCHERFPASVGKRQCKATLCETPPDSMPRQARVRPEAGALRPGAGQRRLSALPASPEQAWRRCDRRRVP